MFLASQIARLYPQSHFSVPGYAIRVLRPSSSMPMFAERMRSAPAIHRFAAADPDPVIRRALLDVRAVNSSILERNSLRIGEVFALL